MDFILNVQKTDLYSYVFLKFKDDILGTQLRMQNKIKTMLIFFSMVFSFLSSWEGLAHLRK